MSKPNCGNHCGSNINKQHTAKNESFVHTWEGRGGSAGGGGGSQPDLTAEQWEKKKMTIKNLNQTKPL